MNSESGCGDKFQFYHNLWNTIGVTLVLAVAIKYIIFTESSFTTFYEFSYITFYFALDIILRIFYCNFLNHVCFMIHHSMMIYLLCFEININKNWDLYWMSMVLIGQITVLFESLQSNNCCFQNYQAYACAFAIVWVLTRFVLHPYLLVSDILMMIDASSSWNDIDFEYIPYIGALTLFVFLSMVWSWQYVGKNKMKIKMSPNNNNNNNNNNEVTSNAVAVATELNTTKLALCSENQTSNNDTRSSTDDTSNTTSATDIVFFNESEFSSIASKYSNNNSKRHSSKIMIEFDKQYQLWMRSKHYTAREIFLNGCKKYPYDSYKYQKYIKSFYSTNEEINELDRTLWKPNDNEVIDKVAFFHLLKDYLLLPIPASVSELQSKFGDNEDIDFKFMSNEIMKQENILWTFFIYTSEDLMKMKKESDIRTYMTYDDFSSGLSGLITATVDWTCDAHKFASNALFEFIDQNRDGIVEYQDIAALLLSMHKMYCAVFNYQQTNNDRKSFTKKMIIEKAKLLMQIDWAPSQPDQMANTMNKLQFAHFFGELSEKHLKHLDISDLVPSSNTNTTVVYMD